MENVEVSIFPGGSKGYGAAGASLTKRSMKGFKAQSGSPREDIDENNYTMRQRCRMLYMGTPIAASGIKTSRTNVIGLGLKLNPKIDREYLGLSAEEAETWERNTKAEFKIWAGRKNACDATGMNDFYEIQQLAFISWLMSGDVFILLKHAERERDRPYTLRLHVIEADRCATPQNVESILFHATEGESEEGNHIYDGVEVDRTGKAVAYYFRNSHPHEMKMERLEYQKVEAYGKKTGLPNVIHVMTAERPEQYRGVSYLAQIIEPLLQMRRYTEAEITAAIIESFFTAFIKTERRTDEMPLNTTEPEGETEQYDPNEYEMGPGQINVMNPGETVEFGEPKRPASGFEAFIKALCTQVGAALEIPRELLMKEFNSSYSASRGALLEAWKSFRMYRQWFSNDFCEPIYEVWLSEAVASGRIQAPGFFGDRRTKEAWLGAEWIGPSQGQLDPVKEITAEILAVENGFSTHEDSTIRLNGGDWKFNMNQLEKENEKMEKIFGWNEKKEDVEETKDEAKQRKERLTNMMKEVLREMMEEKEGEET